MLVSKGYQEGDIVSFKLINGDELITRLEADDTDTVTISRPMAITMGAQGMGLIPWVFLGNSEKITLRKKHTFFIVPSKKEANDPRFKTALTVDIKPDTLKRVARAFGNKVSRAGIPPQAKTNGKVFK